MGKTVKTIIGAALIVGSFFVPPIAFGFAALPAATFVSLSTIMATVGAISVSIGLAPDFDSPSGGKQLADNLHIFSNPVAVRSVAFGKTAVAGQVLFRKNIKNADDTPDEILLILGLTGYPATSLTKFTFNGEDIFTGDSTIGPGAITTGKFADDLWVWFRTGEETTAAFPEIAALSPEWNAKTRILRGICCIGMRLKVTEKVEGRLEPLAEIKGAKLYDPRLDSTVPGGAGTHSYDDPTTWAWSRNPKLAETLYIRGGEVNGVRIFGMGKPKEAIDLEHMASEANICEEQIAVVGGGTINRYDCDGLLIPQPEHAQNLRKLMSASASTADASGGIYRTFAGAWRAPSMTLTESDVDGTPNRFRKHIDPSDVVNVLQGVIADPTDNWHPKEYPSRRDAASIAQVGENPRTLDLPFTIDHRTAQRIAKIEMFRLNAEKMFGANYWLRTLELTPGDIVTQQYARYGLDGTDTFRVHLWALEPSQDTAGALKLTVPMQLVEENQEWFDWDETTEEQSSSTMTRLPTVNRFPKQINLDGGTVTFQGALPPANPKPGWLWRDTDVNILFRWDGAGWVDYATETTRADQVDYLSGASVESLEPAEAAANQTAPRVHDLVNPGFETGDLDGWTSLAGPFAVISTDPHSGTYHLEGAGGGRIANDKRLPVSPGDVVIGKGVGKVAAGTATVRILIEMFDAAGASLQTVSDGIQSTSANYTLLTLRALVPDNAVEAQFEFSTILPSADAVTHFDSASMVHLPSPIDTTGQLREDAAAGDGSTTRSVARGPEPGTARDGDVVTFDPAWSIIPTVRFVGGGRTFSPTLNNSQAQDFQALNLSGSGFTASLKIKELVGATTTHTDNVVSTPSSPVGVDHSINKSQSAEAHDDKYTFQFDVTVNNPSTAEPGFVTVGIYTNNGTGWVQRTTKNFQGQTGETQTVRLNRTETITVSGLGLNDDFGINIELGDGSLNFDNVKYDTATAPATETATPAGAPDVEYLVLGG